MSREEWIEILTNLRDKYALETSYDRIESSVQLGILHLLENLLVALKEKPQS